MILAAGCSRAKGPEVRLFTWDNYDDPAVFDAFERDTGIRVVVDRFASNEELLAKLMAGSGAYDIVVPSDYMVSVMARQGLLKELDKSRLSVFSQMDPRFLNRPYDRGNRYSVPYLWGVTGIGYDRELVKTPPTGWADFWKPEYAGKISLLNDAREVFAMGLQASGYKTSVQDPAVLEKVKQRLVEQKKLVKTYVSENVESVLLSGEVELVHVWSGDLKRAALEKPSLTFVFPKEGGFIFQDNLCVPKNAPNPEGALKLMDFILQARNVARIVEKTRFGAANRESWKLLPKELQSDPTLVPQDAVMRKLEWIPDAGDSSALYDRLWTELKAL
ncbi:MAG: spermidine/putrescine ABC transporter substrate-binding protein [Elusimicrobiota bacterium]